MNRSFFSDGLTTKVYGHPVIFYAITDSTNTRAAEIIKASEATEGLTVVAAMQTNGRGSYGNKWESSNNESLLVSVVVFEQIRHTCLSFIPAIALHKTLNKYNIECHIKWPNDVLVDSKKIAGILCESFEDSIGKRAWVVGMGVNVNQVGFPEAINDKAISMRRLTGINYDIGELFRSFMAEFESIYLSDTEIVKEWKRRSRMIGQTVSVLKNGNTFNVKVIDVSADGHLVIERKNGQIEHWASASDIDILMYK